MAVRLMYEHFDGIERSNIVRQHGATDPSLLLLMMAQGQVEGALIQKLSRVSGISTR